MKQTKKCINGEREREREREREAILTLKSNTALAPMAWWH